MDVFSLLKFWRNAGVGDHITDEEGSFFDLVYSPTVNVISGFNSDHLDGNHTPFVNNNKRPLDSSYNTKTPLMLGFQPKSNKKLEMKFEIEEVTTISSLLKRDHSLNHMPSKRFSKDVVHRYLNLIKPLYIKVSRRNKVRLPQHSSVYTSSPSVFKEVRKHFGKSRSSSSTVKPIPSPAARRDDSALQQQEDGIQSAILHCKKSYNSPSQGCNVLSRSGSAPSQRPRISIEEEKRSSI